MRKNRSIKLLHVSVRRKNARRHESRTLRDMVVLRVRRVIECLYV